MPQRLGAHVVLCGLCTSRQPASRDVRRHLPPAQEPRRHHVRVHVRIPPPPPPPPPVPRAPPPVPLLLPNAIDASAARNGWSVNGGRHREGASVRAQQRRVRVDAVCSTMHAELCSSCQCVGDDGAWRCCDGYLLVMARSAQLSGSPPPPPSGPPPALLSACEKKPPAAAAGARGREDDDDEDEKRVAASLAPKPGTHGRVSKSRKIVTRNGACSSAHVLNDLARCISAAVEE